MNTKTRIGLLKQQLEELFPNKWSIDQGKTRYLKTGFAEIDNYTTQGIARQRITEWAGPVSSGKISILKAMIHKWCASGLNVAYIDAEGKLLACDWAAIENTKGKFWLVRPPEKDKVAQDKSVTPLAPKNTLYLQEALWSADQFIRSYAFDVVVLDLGSINLAQRSHKGLSYHPSPDRIYTRLQRALDKSKASLIVIQDTAGIKPSSANWGCYARFVFDSITALTYKSGLAGIAMITPVVKFNIAKHGITKSLEVTLDTPIPNRLFTHPQVPDRRTSKG